MQKLLNDKEKALTEIFKDFKKEKFPLILTKMELEYKDYCVAYNNSLIIFDNYYNRLWMYSTNDESVEIT